MPQDRIPTLKIDRELTAVPGLMPHSDETTRRLYEESLPSTVQVETERGKGSGWFVDKDGRVVTDAHVVLNAQEVRVRTSSGDLYKARIEKLDDAADLAVLTLSGIRTEMSAPLTIGSSIGLLPDNPVYGMGHPLGLRPAYISPGYYRKHMSVGTYIAAEADLNTLMRLARKEIDATPKEQADIRAFLDEPKLNGKVNLQHGSSGGPILDGEGKVIGVTDFGNVFEDDQFMTPVERVQALVDKPEDKFDFHYTWAPERWASTYLSHWQTAAPAAVLETGLVAGLAAGVAARLPRLGTVGVGIYGAFNLYDDAGDYFASHDRRDDWKYGIASASDLLMTAGAVARFIPAARTIGLVGMGLGISGRIGSDFIPNRLVLTDITRKDGDPRPPFRAANIGIN